MKNVLFILYYFPPMGGSGVQRPLKFIKYLKKYGWNPIVLCPEPGAYHVFDESLNQDLEDLSIEVHRVKGNTLLHTTGSRKLLLPTWLEGFLRKISLFFWLPDNKKGWIKEGFLSAKRIIEDRDIELVFASAPPYSNLMLANRIKKVFDLPLVMDLRDDWLESHFIEYPTRFHRSKMEGMERETLENADCLITINKYIANSIRARFSNRLEIIPHGYDAEDFEEHPNANKKNKKVTFLYSGTFYEQSGPETFLQAVAKFLKANPEYRSRIELQFQGNLNENIRKLFVQNSLDGLIKEFDYVNHKQAVRNLMEADILWMNNAHKKRPEAISFGKTYEYMASGKPILALLPEGDAKDTLEEYGAAYIVDPDDVDATSSAIDQIIKDMEGDKLPELNKEFIATFDREKLTMQLAELFNEISR